MKNLDILRSEFFNHADILFALFDKDLNFIDANEAFLKKLHLERKNVIGKNILEISPDNKSSGRYDLYKEVIRTGKTIIIDDVKPHLSLGNFYVRIKAFKIGEGLATASGDITDLKELTESFELFAYKSSHDMRAPIANILGLINLASEDLNDNVTASQYLGMIKQQVEKMGETVSRQIDETRRVREPDKILNLIDFRQLIEDVLKSLAYVKGFKNIRIDKDISPVQNFYSNKTILISLFQNIIDNAIKYRNEDIDDAFLKIIVEEEKDNIKITFADNGIGIADNLQKDIFNKFFRATDKAQGNGLGLYTLNHYIKKIGGEITLNSIENIGTTFNVYLPKKTN